MNIEVTKDNVVILKDSNTPHENEYKITTCYFTFDEFTNAFQVKRAIFTILSSDEMYETDIVNNECDIPIEVLKHEYETIKVGVYGYNIGEEEELEKRFSPSYDTFVVPSGSYREGALSPEPITPSQYDIYSQALQEGLSEVESALQEVENVDIDAEQLENGASITITNRNGEPKTVEVHDGEDGASFEYDWDGTSLGVKTSEEQDYEYVDLKGDKGDQGIPGKDGYTPQKGIDYFTPQDIASLNIPRKTSDLNNDSGFIDKSVNDLVNYYNKTETYNKTEIDSKISSVYKYKGSVATYEDLPSSGLTIGDVYNVESDGSNYAWNGTVWDKLGGDVDLSNYYNKTQTDTLLNGKVDTNTLNDYYTKTRTDELLATKVGFTDYATQSTSGIIMLSNTYGTGIDNGRLYAQTKTYSAYESANGLMFISKNTLENVITGKELVNKTYVDDLVGDIATTLDTIQRESV